MTIVPPKNRLLEQQIPADGDVLHAKLMMPKPPLRPQRVVFIAPLVGAGAAQPLRIFRNFTRRGSILLSFEYRGHGRSTGVFDLDSTLRDVHHSLVWAWNYANDHNLPLHGFATCYGTVSLLAQFKKDGCGCLLRSISTVSGLFRLDQILRFEDFAPIASRHLGQRLTADQFLEALTRQTFDGNGHAFRNALFEYLTGLFPQLRVGHDFFEELCYERVNIPQTLLQLSRARYLDGVSVPPEIPCHVFAGRNDDTLSLRTPAGREAYRKQVLSLVPHAVLHEHEFDHFGRGVEHDPVIEQLADLFERHDTSASVPPHHLHAAPQASRVPR